MIILLFLSLSIFAVSLYAANLSKTSAADTTKKTIYSPVNNFAAAYTVTRTYTSKGSVIINNLWRSSVQLAGGGDNNCALSNGKIYCWGKGTNGQLGNNASINRVTPVAVYDGILNGQRMTNIAGGANHMCAINSGLAACWGDNTYGQLGNNSLTTSFNVPQQVAVFGPLYTVSQIAAGARNGCAISANLALCWGDNSSGQVGDNTLTTRRSPVSVTASAGLLGGKSVTQVQVGGLFACALANGGVYCWGDNTYGQLGNSSNTSSRVPVRVTHTGVLTGKTVTQIATGNEHACAIADGQAYCWGRNNYGQLGTGNTSNTNSPAAVSTSSGMSSTKVVTNILNGGYSHTCAVADGQAYCWGRDDLGQLGDNDATNSSKSSPVAVNVAGVLSGKGVTQMTGGASYTCAVANGRAYCWGDNSFGQLGVNDTLPAFARFPYRVNDGYY